MADSDKRHLRHLHLYAIVRFDFPTDQQYPENTTAVVKVLSSKDLAEGEAQRLKQVNRDKTCNYVVYTTRYMEESN
jgi:hypothetical protein